MQREVARSTLCQSCRCRPPTSRQMMIAAPDEKVTAHARCSREPRVTPTAYVVELLRAVARQPRRRGRYAARCLHCLRAPVPRSAPRMRRGYARKCRQRCRLFCFPRGQPPQRRTVSTHVIEKEVFAMLVGRDSFTLFRQTGVIRHTRSFERPGESAPTVRRRHLHARLLILPSRALRLPRE